MIRSPQSTVESLAGALFQTSSRARRLFRRLRAPLRRDPAATRRAAVVGAAVALLLLTLLPRQADLQRIDLSYAGHNRQLIVPAGGAQAQRLRAIAGRSAEHANGPMPVAYCQARWQFEAANHYICQLQMHIAAGSAATAAHPRIRGNDSRGSVAFTGWSDAAAGDGVSAVSYQVAAEPSEEAAAQAPYGIAYWETRRQAAQLQMQQTLAQRAALSGVPLTVRLGAVEPGPPLPSSALLALLAGCGAAALHRLRRPMAPRLLCYAHCQVAVPAGWVRQRPSTAEQLRQGTYACAWLVIGACALSWYV